MVYILSSQVVNPVTVRRRMMRRVLALPQEKLMKDRIHNGQPSVNPHWLGTVAHSVRPSVHPIVEVYDAQSGLRSSRS